jgi:hypothetical protein
VLESAQGFYNDRAFFGAELYSRHLFFCPSQSPSDPVRRAFSLVAARKGFTQGTRDPGRRACSAEPPRPGLHILAQQLPRARTEAPSLFPRLRRVLSCRAPVPVGDKRIE